MPAPADPLPLDEATRQALSQMQPLTAEQAESLAAVLDHAATRVRQALIDAAAERGCRDAAAQ